MDVQAFCCVCCISAAHKVHIQSFHVFAFVLSVIFLKVNDGRMTEPGPVLICENAVQEKDESVTAVFIEVLIRRVCVTVLQHLISLTVGFLQVGEAGIT